MKFAVFFVMFFLFLICFTTAQTLIQDSCKKAAAKDPLFKYDFCVKSLETDPHSKAATNLKGLLIASTKNADDYRSASVHLSAALDAPTTCETGFKETIHKKSPCKTANDLSELTMSSLKDAEMKMRSVKATMKKNFLAKKYLN
ncbi:hypothetical protein IGI04_034967 [Brassica rapa subsp. trilocularis]|uniref:Pectinesterase inhibitor domain-containing protein n=1 Tax=Brassica rapa subsp. trilocularis TaxID=1813537 RepID=A0ABQ7LAA2_BRACM|nr:hypothetical protein IGI04_034967 [Brassica rapa subsp. trilocularis]